MSLLALTILMRKGGHIVLPGVESAGAAFHVAHDVAFVGEAEIFDEAVSSEKDFGGLDFHEGARVGNAALPILATPDPDLPAAGNVFS